MLKDLALPYLRVRTLGDEICTRPGVRRVVKVLLDAGFAAIAWVVAYSLFRRAYPTPLSTLGWVACAMAVNAAFQHTRQLYRFTGFEEVRSLLLSLVAMIGIALGGFVMDRYLRLGIENPDITLAASLLTFMLWVLFRAATVDFFRHRFLKTHPHHPTVERRKTPRVGSPTMGGLARRTLIIVLAARLIRTPIHSVLY